MVCVSAAWSYPILAEGWFPVRNHNPLVLTQVAPGLQIDTSPASGRWLAQVHYSLSNTLNQASSAREALTLDGETEVLTLGFTRGIADGMAYWIQLPWIRHSGGSLDRLIDRYHGWLGLPEGQRPGWPRDRLRFEYQRDGTTLLRLVDTVDGLGDISMGIWHLWPEVGRNRLQLLASLKLPTGDASRLTGSGAAALGAVATLERSLAERWRGMLQAGVTGLAGGDVLPHLQRRVAGSLGAGVAWSFSPRVELRAQVDAATGLYRDSALRLLNEVVLLTAGVSVRPNSRWTLDLAVTEDLMVDAAPDVTFQIGLSRRY
ncbi:MAG: DUF3187 family protein [Thiotrichales bacterium]